MGKRFPFGIGAGMETNAGKGVANCDGNDVPSRRDDALQATVFAVPVTDVNSKSFHLWHRHDGLALPVHGTWDIGQFRRGDAKTAASAPTYVVGRDSPLRVFSGLLADL